MQALPLQRLICLSRECALVRQMAVGCIRDPAARNVPGILSATPVEQENRAHLLKYNAGSVVPERLLNENIIKRRLTIDL